MNPASFEPPKDGAKITSENGNLLVPDEPIIPCIEGDGIGEDISPAMRLVVDAAVIEAYGSKRRIRWWPLPVGEVALREFGESLPQMALDALREYKVAIKGPLTTPVGEGIRSLNVALRQELDLYTCLRPVSYIQGLPSPMKNPSALDVVIFRENSEDIYIGIEFRAEEQEAKKIIGLLSEIHPKKIAPDSGIGIKPMSRMATERITRAAVEYAIRNERDSITIVHKGNIQKYTEGAFRNWAYEYLAREYRGRTISEEEIEQGVARDGRILVKDRIADAMFQQLLLRPAEYDVILTTNLNGDYISDACAAQIGGLGMAPGGNIGDETAIFEATHGTAPKYAGQDKVNPGSLILSAAMMLVHLGWTKAAKLIEKGLADTIKQKTVTYDLERQMQGASLLSCSGFAQAIADNIRKGF